MFQQLKNVLIVDDADDQRLMLKRFLETFGFQLLLAEDGAEAVKILQGTIINLIITDFRMPKMNGAELIHWCRSHSLHMPIILLSTETHRLEAEKSVMIDCCSILVRSKPIDFALLTDAIHAADRHGHQDDCTFQTFKEAMEKEKLFSRPETYTCRAQESRT